MPAPAPAWCIGRLRLAVVVSGAQTNELPTPSSAIEPRTCHSGVSAAIAEASSTSEIASTVSPAPARTRGCTRSVRRPAIGASTIDTTAIGASSSPAWVGESPRTSCAHSISGKPIDAKTKPTAAMATLASEKLRSRKSDSGISGSRLLRDCHHTKTAPMTRPATIIVMTVADQSRAWPSWMPKTSRRRAAPLSSTPSQSKECWCTSSAGTRRHASQKPTMPTGMLMKKIHSHPATSTSTPPRIGPTSVATPAVAPHRLIAEPRLSRGKIRVITAIVCGARAAAPKPWSTRAATSIQMLCESSKASPHHSEARVKTTRPPRYIRLGPIRSPSRPVIRIGTA